MRNFQEKKGWRRVAESKPVLLILLILLLIFAWSVFRLVGKMQDTIENRQRVEQKIAELEEIKTSLSADISKLSTEEGKEESIREKFGWAKEGEGIIVVVDEKNSADTEEKEESGGFFSWLKNLFK